MSTMVSSCVLRERFKGAWARSDSHLVARSLKISVQGSTTMTTANRRFCSLSLFFLVFYIYKEIERRLRAELRLRALSRPWIVATHGTPKVARLEPLSDAPAVEEVPALESAHFLHVAHAGKEFKINKKLTNKLKTTQRVVGGRRGLLHTHGLIRALSR